MSCKKSDYPEVSTLWERSSHMERPPCRSSVPAVANLNYYNTDVKQGSSEISRLFQHPAIWIFPDEAPEIVGMDKLSLFVLPKFLTYRIVSIIKSLLFYTTKSNEVNYAAIKNYWKRDGRKGESQKSERGKKEEREQGGMRRREGGGRKKGGIKKEGLISPEVLLNPAFFMFYHNGYLWRISITWFSAFLREDFST